MEKRLTTSAMVFSVGFVFMLVCVVGAFFYGVQFGMDRVESRFASAETEAAERSAASVLPYQQQDLVSFYHTVFSPYREFQNEWLTAMNKLTQGQAEDAASMFGSLAKLADRKAGDAGSFEIGKSVLLGDAQVGYIRSLKLFREAANKAAESAKSLSGSELTNAVLTEKNYVSAAREALDAQRAYYTAMHKWAASVDLELPADYAVPSALALKDWSAQPLVVKNVIVVSYLAERGELHAFYPQDLSGRIDDFISSGHAAKMKLQTVGAIVDLLINTDAVRVGQFTEFKSRFYKAEMLPMLPFFLPDPD